MDLLNGSLLSIKRSEIINKINNLDDERHYILISTQSIEAGVDVSFDFVFRDFATLDSIEQVRGRCNRSGELYKKFKNTNQKGNVYLTEIKQNSISLYSYIYDEIEKQTRIKESKKILREKLNYNYSKIELYYDKVSESINNQNDADEDNFIITDRENIKNWINFNFSKLNNPDGINIINDNLKQYTVFVATKLPILKSEDYNKTISQMDKTELEKTYNKYPKNFNFSQKEIEYLKTLNNEIIKDNCADGNIILNEYIKKHKMLTENKEWIKYKIFKKEMSSILSKFIFNVTLTKEDLQIQIEALDSFSFFYILPNDDVGEEDFKIYSLDKGFNYDASE